MNNEYIIVNKTAIEKRVAELEQISKEFYYREGIDEYDFAKDELKGILSQSTPLIPEIEKAFDTGKTAYITSKYIHDTPSFEDQKKDHISNLKLDI